jgi:hypothetical protein
MSAETDDTADLELPPVESDAASTGAAADCADWDERLKGLPRLLRYAILIRQEARHIMKRLVAEISQLRPGLPHTVLWATSSGMEPGLALAAELDRLAVTENEPVLRSLADCVRLLCLQVPRDAASFEAYRRVGKALIEAFRKIERNGIETKLCAEIEEFVYGWAAAPACTDVLAANVTAAHAATLLGANMAAYRLSVAKREMRQTLKAEEDYRKQQEDEAKTAAERKQGLETDSIPADHVVVARLSTEAMKNIKLKDILGPLKSVINVALPLATVPDLHHVRHALMFEFPYACDVIDFALADLVGHTTVHLRPLLIVGEPGGGKSRFARRLGELLGLNVWREDASRADGAVFGGTDRRWYSAEPCHAFLAIAQGKIANPLVLIDEIEKAGTRNDYGRLWDCLLGFLEVESAARYPDPALQTPLDLSHVSYISTANSIDPLPSPIRDRFRVVTFPKPSPDHLNALLPAILADLARERGLDRRWVMPLDNSEHAAVARHWRGGSVRRLRRIVEAVLHHREGRATRN